jgi:hypothetical protein
MFGFCVLLNFGQELLINITRLCLLQCILMGLGKEWVWTLLDREDTWKTCLGSAVMGHLDTTLPWSLKHHQLLIVSSNSSSVFSVIHAFQLDLQKFEISLRIKNSCYFIYIVLIKTVLWLRTCSRIDLCVAKKHAGLFQLLKKYRSYFCWYYSLLNYDVSQSLHIF